MNKSKKWPARIPECDETFQAKYDALKKKYPLLQTLSDQGVTYEQLPDCKIKHEIDQELGITGYKTSPVYQP